MVRITLIAYKQKYHDIESSLITYEIDKRNTQVAQAPRYVCCLSVRRMIVIVEQKHFIKVSCGSVFNLCPFFVTMPSGREKCLSGRTFLIL